MKIEGVVSARIFGDRAYFAWHFAFDKQKTSELLIKLIFFAFIENLKAQYILNSGRRDYNRTQGRRGH